jgi:hypothetical protein
VLSALESQGFFSGEETAVGKSNISLVDIKKINQVWEQHGQFAASFPQFGRLTGVRDKINEWSSNFDQALTSETLSLRERCNQLANLRQNRPKGVTVKPTPETISLWLQVFTWPLSVHEKTTLLIEQYQSWKANYQHETLTNEMIEAQLISLMKANLGLLLVEGGQIFLLESGSPAIFRLRDEAIELICGSSANTTILSTAKLVDSTCHVTSGLNHVFVVKVDEAVRSSLTLLRVWFWKVMVKSFIHHISSSSKCNSSGESCEMYSLPNAKTLLSLCPRNPLCVSVITDDKTDEMQLQTMIRDADELQGRSNAILSHATDLLREKCFMRKDELKLSVDGLSSLQTDFKNSPNVRLMLWSSGLEEKISRKRDALLWLLKTMNYPILWGDEHSDGNAHDDNKDCRILLEALRDLHLAIPHSQESSEMDAEFSRMVSKVKNLVNSASQWQGSCRILHDGAEKIVELFAIRAIAQASILSMVSERSCNLLHLNSIAILIHLSYHDA